MLKEPIMQQNPMKEPASFLDEISEAATKLSAMADDLRELMNRFTI